MSALVATAALAAVYEGVPATDTSSAVASVRVTVRVVETAPPRGPVNAILSAVRLSPTPGGPSESPIPIPVSVPGTATVSLDREGSWEITAVAKGYWSAPARLRPGGGRSIEVLMWPVGSVTSRVEPLSTSEILPPSLTVRAREAPPYLFSGTPDGLDASFDCPIATGELHCELPAGVLDLRISGPGFTPTYLWDVVVSPDKDSRLRNTVLREGASLSGWVVFGAPGPRPACELALAPAGFSPGPSPEDEARRAQLTRHGTANGRGFFQFTGLEPGRYTLKASAAGFVPSVLEGLEVSSNLETQLREPLTLATPRAFSVFVDPPRDSRQEPWAVSFVPTGSRAQNEGATTHVVASDAGEARFEGLASGRYRVFVEDRFGQHWWDGNITVEDSTPPQFVHIAMVAVEGRLLVGTTPSEGIVAFSAPSDSRKIFCGAHEEGRFQCVLPSPGMWDVDVQPKGSHAKVEVKPVEVEVPADGGPASLEIVVPDRSLSGRVVDERGAPLPGARVRLVHIADHRASSAKADADGVFKLEGLVLGPASVQATHPRGVSRSVMVDVREQEPSEPLVLTIKPRGTVRGRVDSPFGPVAGALIQGIPHFAGPGVAMVAEATTSVDGSFELQLLNQATTVTLLVVAPGLGARLLQAAVGEVDNQPLEIQVQPSGGTLEIEAPSGMASKEMTNLMLVHEGVSAPFVLLARAGILSLGSSEMGSRAILQSLAPGDYSVCRQGSAGTCASGFVPPGGRLNLRLQ